MATAPSACRAGGRIKVDVVGEASDLWEVDYSGSTVFYAGAGLYVDDSRVL